MDKQQFTISSKPEGINVGNFYTMGVVDKNLVKVYCGEVDFNFDVSDLEDILNLSLKSNSIGYYLNMNGLDLSENVYKYSILIEKEMIKSLAWNVFTTLVIKNGKYFVQENLNKWENWFN